jgi:hypothetical protein
VRIYILTLKRRAKHDSAEGVARVDVRLLQGNVSAMLKLVSEKQESSMVIENSLKSNSE